MSDQVQKKTIRQGQVQNLSLIYHDAKLCLAIFKECFEVYEDGCLLMSRYDYCKQLYECKCVHGPYLCEQLLGDLGTIKKDIREIQTLFRHSMKRLLNSLYALKFLVDMLVEHSGLTPELLVGIQYYNLLDCSRYMFSKQRLTVSEMQEIGTRLRAIILYSKVHRDVFESTQDYDFVTP